MKLIEITKDHYVVVDYSEIENGDSVYVNCSELGVKDIRKVSDYYNEQYLFEGGGQIHIDYCKKITHSTQPLSDECKYCTGYCEQCVDVIKPLSISEVEELICEVDKTECEVEFIDGKFKQQII